MVGEGRTPLRPRRYRIAVAAHAVGKLQHVIQDGYALSYLMAGIDAVPPLDETIVFKGGTCLREAYLPAIAFGRI